MARTTKTMIKASLIDEVTRAGKANAYTLSLINDYMDLWDLKGKAIRSIKKDGISITYQNGENQYGEKTNPAMSELNRIIRSMDLILRSLGARPSDSSGRDDGIDL